MTGKIYIERTTPHRKVQVISVKSGVVTYQYQTPLASHARDKKTDFDKFFKLCE